MEKSVICLAVLFFANSVLGQLEMGNTLSGPRERGREVNQGPQNNVDQVPVVRNSPSFLNVNMGGQAVPSALENNQLSAPNNNNAVNSSVKENPEPNRNQKPLPNVREAQNQAEKNANSLSPSPTNAASSRDVVVTVTRAKNSSYGSYATAENVSGASTISFAPLLVFSASFSVASFPFLHSFRH
jgi:hypothetical protein